MRRSGNIVFGCHPGPGNTPGSGLLGEGVQFISSHSCTSSHRACSKSSIMRAFTTFLLDMMGSSSAWGATLL
jgi:hypothetical protein